MGGKKRKEEPAASSATKSTESMATESRPSKRAKAEDGSIRKRAAPMIVKLKEDEPMFPRGGGSLLTPLEHKEISAQARQDVLFEQKSTANEAKETKESQRRRRRSEATKEAATKAFKEETVRIEALNFKRLAKSSLVLGQIIDIKPYELQLALPNSLVGYVPITSVSETLNTRLQAAAEREDDEDGEKKGEDEDRELIKLSELFVVGQYLRAYVVSTLDDASTTSSKGRRRIDISIRPAQANSGMIVQDLVEKVTVMASVLSVEDHGYVMDLGLPDAGVRAFLNKNELDPSIAEQRMQPGSALLCMVTGKSSNGKVLQLTTLEEKVGGAQSHVDSVTTISTLLPGTLVDVLVSDVIRKGLVGKVLGHLDATADLVHSGAGPNGVDLEQQYKAGSRVRARIICTFPEADTPKVGVSLQSHVLWLKSKTVKKDGMKLSPIAVLPHSTQIKSCSVLRVESDVGLYVDVGLGEENAGFVHISRVKDGKIDALFETSGPYKVGSTHPGRIIGYSAFDGIHLVSLQKSIIEQPFLRIEDIPVGELVSGTIEGLVVNASGLGGATVKLADGISGLVPEMHLADVHLQHPEKKFRPGMKVKARVLSTNPAKHQLRLTLKKTLVNTDAPLLKSFDDAVVGIQTSGTIVKVMQSGAIVQFYGQLRGFLPVSEMSEAYIADPNEHFRVGQVVSVHVLTCDPEANKLIVSCKDPSDFGLEKHLALQKVEVGSLVSARVTQKTEDNVFVELMDSGLKATMSVGHLADKAGHKTQSALKKIYVGQNLDQMVVLEKDESRRVVKLSIKPSLVKASKQGKLICGLDDAKIGEIVSGWVRNIALQQTGVIVEFPGRTTAFLPASLLSEEDRRKEGFGLQKLQSLAVKIVSVDPDRGRLIVSMPSAEKAELKVVKGEVQIALNPIDKSIFSAEDLYVGKLTKAKIRRVTQTQLNVSLADNIQGRVNASEVYDKYEDIGDPKNPLDRFKVGDIIPVRILGVHDARNHRFLPISHRSTHAVLELSIKPSQIKEGPAPEPLSHDKLESGYSTVGIVNNVEKTHLWVNLSPDVRGRVSAIEASNDVSLAQDLPAHFVVGTALPIRVVYVNAATKHLDLSARSGPRAELTWDMVEPNMILAGRVTKLGDRAITVKLSEQVAGQVGLADLCDNYDEANLVEYSKNNILRVSIVEVDKKNKKLRLSTRASRIMSAGLPVKDREITAETELQAGDLIRGFIKNISDKGVFIHLGGNMTARVKIRDLSDDFIKSWKENLQVNQLVNGRITSLEDGRISMSLRPSVIRGDFKPPLSLIMLKKGQIVTGKVRKVEDYGAFIDIDGSDRLSGLAHRKQMASKPVDDARKLYTVGDLVKAKVLDVEIQQKRISLGLKPSYFDDEDDEEDEEEGKRETAGAEVTESSDDGGGEQEDQDVEMGDAGGVTIFTGLSCGQDDSEDGQSDKEDDDAEMIDAPTKRGLDAGGFDWTAGLLDVDKDINMDATVSAEPGKKGHKRREPKIQVDKTAELDVHGPQTASDYERLLLGQHDSSELWIAYMAFQMQIGDLESARKVAERAIQTIDIREEAEKLNVWVAYLNLEVEYGTKDTLAEVFKRACRHNDDVEVFARLASIYIKSDRYKEAESLFDRMLTKFGSTHPSVWTNYAHFLHTKNKTPDRARALLKRATQSLSPLPHIYIPLVAKFAALEFCSPNGNREQGRTLFESLLATYPKKFDVWDQLLDLEIAAGEREKARDAFERATRAKGLKKKRAKGLFKRWARWEEQYGDAKSRERVSRTAQEWVRERGNRKEGEA